MNAPKRGRSGRAAYDRGVEPVGGIDGFINEMHVAVAEECFLWELAGGTIDLEPEGPVQHGPWDAAACAAVMQRWLGKGLVELHLLPERLPADPGLPVPDWVRRATRRDSRLILTRNDAQWLLSHPAVWELGTIEGSVQLSLSDRGVTSSPEVWAAGNLS